MLCYVSELKLNSWFEQNTLVTAQRALAVVYEHNYPFSDTVRQGLERILNERYGGSQQDFTTKFIRSTIALLKNLKAKVSSLYLLKT